MDIEEFVTNTLKQIIGGMKSASSDEFRFDLDSSTSKGVHFNLAVINSEKEEKKSGGKGGLSIKVVSADYGKENIKTAGAETISRIEFNIKHRDLVQEKNDAEFARTYNS